MALRKGSYTDPLARTVKDPAARHKLRKEALQAAYDALSPSEQAALERQVAALLGIKNVGREAALEVLAAIGRRYGGGKL